MTDKIDIDNLRLTVVLRGYDRRQVDSLIRQAADALASDRPELRAAAGQALSRPVLQITLRGYDRREVDTLLARLAAELTNS